MWNCSKTAAGNCRGSGRNGRLPVSCRERFTCHGLPLSQRTDDSSPRTEPHCTTCRLAEKTIFPRCLARRHCALSRVLPFSLAERSMTSKLKVCSPPASISVSLACMPLRRAPSTQSAAHRQHENTLSSPTHTGSLLRAAICDSRLPGLIARGLNSKRVSAPLTFFPMSATSGNQPFSRSPVVFLSPPFSLFCRTRASSSLPRTFTALLFRVFCL